MPAFELAQAQTVTSPDDCLFYHSMDIPGHGEVTGQWDLRGHELQYLGGISLKGKSVLEIGPASGFFSFWMERQGARVTALDLHPSHKWDGVPYHDVDAANFAAERRDMLRRMNNSWWFAHDKFRSQAKMVYGSVYDIGPALGSFDIVTLTSVLLHLRDPLLAIEKAASVCKGSIVITDVSERQFLGSTPQFQDHLALHFMPRAAARTPIDAWWQIPSLLVVEWLSILGLKSTAVTHHHQKFHDGYKWHFYTVVGGR